MNLPHVHLLLNHFPTIGFSIGIGLFLVAIAVRSDDLKRASLAVFFLIALVTIATYTSGNAAAEAIKERPEFSDALIKSHESAALLAYLFMEITGFIAWLGLWQFRQISRLPAWNTAAVLILSLVTFGLMANAANIGGDIRHPEIQSAPLTETAAGEESPTTMARSLGDFVTAYPWVWPACETLHFVGLSLLFTVVLLVDLRLLGMAKRLSFASLYQLLPWGMLGFGINLVTGMLFFIGTPQQYTKNIAFYWKIGLIMLAGVNALYFMFFDETWAVGPGDDAPLRAKVVAASTIFLWLGVLFFGHMLPFIGNAF